MKVQEIFGDRLGDDVHMYSISLDSKVDTPEDLAEYAELYGCKEGWTFFTGDYDEIETIRHRMGAYDPDPEIDKDKTQHAGICVYGNEATGRWAAIPGLMKPAYIARSVDRLASF